MPSPSRKRQSAFKLAGYDFLGYSIKRANSYEDEEVTGRYSNSKFRAGETTDGIALSRDWTGREIRKGRKKNIQYARGACRIVKEKDGGEAEREGGREGAKFVRADALSPRLGLKPGRRSFRGR